MKHLLLFHDDLGTGWWSHFCDHIHNISDQICDLAGDHVGWPTWVITFLLWVVSLVTMFVTHNLVTGLVINNSYYRLSFIMEI